MFWTNTKRILRSGFTNFWRNSVVSLASVLIMAVTLGVIGGTIFLGAMLNASLDQLKDKVDVNVYFLTEAPEASVLALKRQLEELPEVAEVEYISREEALENFRARHEDDQLTLQALDELSDNPLGAILNIRAQETEQYESIARFLEGDTALGARGTSIIDRVNFFENQVAIERLSSIISAAERLGLVVTLVLALVSVIITFNTIRLAIYTAREEISVMRLVGANNKYIRGPFVIEGMLYGVAAGLLTLLFFVPLTLWLGPATETFFGDINIFEYYVGNFGQIFLLIVFSGIVLGALSSYLAVRKYLKV